MGIRSSPSLRCGIANVRRGVAEEIGHADAGDRHRPLKGEEQARPGALVRLHGQHVLTVQFDAAGSDLIARMAEDGETQRAFAGAVRAHQGVDFAAVDGERNAFENRFVGDAYVKIGNGECVGHGESGGQATGDREQDEVDFNSCSLNPVPCSLYFGFTFACSNTSLIFFELQAAGLDAAAAVRRRPSSLRVRGRPSAA